MHRLKVESSTDRTHPDTYDLTVVISLSLEHKGTHRPSEAQQADQGKMPVDDSEHRGGENHSHAASPVGSPSKGKRYDSSALDPELVAEGIEWSDLAKWNRASPFRRMLVYAVIGALSSLDCCELTALPFAGALYLCGTHEAEPTAEDIIIVFGNDFDEAQAAKIMRTEAEQFASFQYALAELSPPEDFSDEVPAAMSWNLRRFLAMPRGEKLGVLILHAAEQALDYEY